MSTSSSHLPTYWNQALGELSQKDKILAKIIAKGSKQNLTSKGDAFWTLTRSIVGQQISIQAAASIWQKMESAVSQITYKNFLYLSLEKMSSLGLSKQKASYIQNIAKHFQKNKIDNPHYWQGRDYKNIFDELVQIKGIGPWTIEMFAIFYLLEPDIFPTKDLGIMRAMNRLYNKGEPLKTEKILVISRKWKPWRTVASFFLWNSIDSDIVDY